MHDCCLRGQTAGGSPSRSACARGVQPQGWPHCSSLSWGLNSQADPHPAAFRSGASVPCPPAFRGGRPGHGHQLLPGEGERWGEGLQGTLDSRSRGQKMVLLLMSWLLCLWASISFSAGFYELTPFHLPDSYPRLGPAPVSPPPGSPSFYSLPPLRSVLTTGWCPPHATHPPPEPGHPQFSVNIHVPSSVLAPNVDASSPWRVILEPETLAKAHLTLPGG